MKKAIIIRGNGDTNPDENWFPYITSELEKLGVRVLNVKFPDQMLARAKYWLPFIQTLGTDESTILIGHSSGAVAAMRYAEKNKILGSILVGVYYTDLGNEDEKNSGYFDEPWNWEAIKANQKWIIEFASTDDPFIPIEQPRFIHEKLATEYYEVTDQGHYGSRDKKVVFPEMVGPLKNKLN